MGESAAVPPLDPAEGGDDEPFLGPAWAEAIEATELLRSALAALGLAGEIPRLRGDVNVYGRPMVTVGRITPTAARALAAALCRAAQHQPRIYGQAAPPDGENAARPAAPGGGAVSAGGLGGPAGALGSRHAAAGEPLHRTLRPPRTATPLNLPVAVPMATVLPVTPPAPVPAPGQPPAVPPGVSPADSIRLPA